MNRERKVLGPPPRWVDCPRKGDIIQGKFLPMKTMLDDKYNEQIPEYSRFNVDLMFASLKSYKVKMGLLIDLTNTTRFYNSADIEKHECKYVKLQCRGHGETPSEDQTSAFIEVCSRFISQKPLEIIGVHCTHGFNRTGFLISAYLVERLSWSIEAAVRAFAEARPPGIYKQDYLDALFTQYGDKEYTPEAPPLPEWCDEAETVDDDGNRIQASNSNPRKGRRREVMKMGAIFLPGIQVKGVNQVTAQPRLSNVQRRCQDICEWKSAGFPGSQPVSMDINNLNYLKEKPYKVSWKADGTRYMMLVDGMNEVYMIDRDNTVFHIQHLQFPRRKDLNAHIKDTLLDGEMIIDHVEGKPVPRYLIYDIIRFDGQEVGKINFGTRLVCIEKDVIGPRHTKIMQGKLDKTKDPFSVRLKPFWDVVASRKILDGGFAKQVSHEVDGLVFQPVPDPYMPGRCKDVLKWKPPDMNSIDFKLKIVREQREGMLAETKACLYVLGQDPPLATMTYTKALKEYDGKIIECSWDGRNWKFMRQRTDKSHPNSIHTARGVWESISSPVTKDILFKVVESDIVKQLNTKSQPVKRRHPEHKEGGDRELMPPPPKFHRQ